MRSLLQMMTAIVAAVAAVLSFLQPISAFTGVSLYRSIPNQVGLGNVAPALSRPQVSMVAKMENVAAVVLAGGVGKRMEAGKPKQFLELDGKPVLEHSLDLFRSFKGVSQVIVVLDKQYRHEYDSLCEKDSRVVFADPGKERQDSVFNALQKVDVGASVVCIHDSARPLVRKRFIRKVIADANEHGAAVLGVLMKVTVKESEDGEFVLRTIDRSRLWDIQTPQEGAVRRCLAGADEEIYRVDPDMNLSQWVGTAVIMFHNSDAPRKEERDGTLYMAGFQYDSAGPLVLDEIFRAADGSQADVTDWAAFLVVKPDILRKGFKKAKEEGWAVTDDGSIVEQLGLPVKLTMGEYTNIKLTTPDDLIVASQILEERRKKIGTKDDDDDDDDEEEERLSETRANAKWSNRPQVETPPSTGDQYESLSERRAKEEWSKKASSAPEPVSAKKEDEGYESISIKRANEAFSSSASAGGETKQPAEPMRKTMRGRPPPENVSRNRVQAAKPEDMGKAWADLREKKDGMWKERGVAPPGSVSPPRGAQNSTEASGDMFPKE